MLDVSPIFPRHSGSCTDRATYPPGPGHEFTVVSYNVLSQHLYELHPDLYVGAPPEDAAWHVRGPRLWAQLVGLRPDVSTDWVLPRATVRCGPSLPLLHRGTYFEFVTLTRRALIK